MPRVVRSVLWLTVLVLDLVEEYGDALITLSCILLLRRAPFPWTAATEVVWRPELRRARSLLSLGTVHLSRWCPEWTVTGAMSSGFGFLWSAASCPQRLWWDFFSIFLCLWRFATLDLSCVYLSVSVCACVYVHVCVSICMCFGVCMWSVCVCVCVRVCLCVCALSAYVCMCLGFQTACPLMYSFRNHHLGALSIVMPRYLMFCL